MHSNTLITFVSFLAAAAAVTIIEPKLDAKLDFSQSNTITWSSVDSDPETVQIVLASQSSSNISTTVIANSVKTSDNKYTFSNFVAPVGSDYKINFLGTEKDNQGIVAQSQEFDVTKSGVAATTTSSASSATGTADASGSATASPSPSSAAGSVGVTFGVTGSLLAICAILF